MVREERAAASAAEVEAIAFSYVFFLPNVKWKSKPI